MKNRFTFVLTVVLTVVATLVLGGCSFDPSTITVPGSTVSGPTYRVHIEFTNALNLPSKANVVANGARVGNLEKVRVVDPSQSGPGYVVADVDISESVVLPSMTQAKLQQNTVLGDIYIALTTPPTGFGDAIPPGGTIPLSQTAPPLQLEDTLAGVAVFVGGGAINALQGIVNRVNAVMPQDPKETARISAVLGADLTDISANLGVVQTFGRAVEADVQAVVDNQRALSELLTDEGATHVNSAINSVIQLIGVLGALGGLAHAVEWLSPLLTAGDAAAKAVVPLLLTSRPLDLNAPSNLNALVSLIRDRIIPFAQRPQVRVVGVDAPQPAAPVSTDDQTNSIIDALRMIGAVR